MPLLGPPRARLREALVSAFQTPETLHRFSRDVLSIQLNRRSPPNVGLDDNADALITIMDEDGKLPELLKAARSERPNNPDLRAVETEFQLTFNPFSDVQGAPPDIDVKIRNYGAERVIVDSAGFPSAQAFIAKLGVAEYRVCYLAYALPGGKTTYGTGFLVADDLVLTNYHVISRASPPESVFTLSGSQIKAVFGYRTNDAQTVSYTLADTDWLVASHPDKLPDGTPGLDYALLRLSAPAGSERIGQTTEAAVRGYLRPISYTPSENEPILILQHPYDEMDAQPSPMRLTIGFVSKFDEKEFRHTANTSRGSSGAPVFNGRMDLIALHFWGDVGYNKAIRFSSVTADLVAKGIALWGQ